ncbi:MAG TPA: PQQ-dependent sugar dehydrogenase [Chryseosolibacter sp.]
MNRKRFLSASTSFLVIASLFLTACNSSSDKNISTDPAIIAKGETEFSKNCSSCHNFRQDAIGPQLGGITETTSPKWIKSFIKDPKATVESGDERGRKLVAQFKTMMPSFGYLSEEDLDALVAYLHTQQAPKQMLETGGEQELPDPIPGPIQSSDLAVGLELVAQMPFVSEKGFRTRITKLDYIPGSDRDFVVDIYGKLYELRNGKPAVYMDIAKLRPNFINKPGLATGFGSFAFHPEFTKNGLLYTGHAEAPHSATADFHYADSIPVTLQWVVTEWKVDEPGNFPFKGKGRELFRIDMVTGMHGVQEITFNPNSKPGDDDYGLLYIGIGDGACVEAGYPFLVNSITRPWGTIFRIDPRGNDSANNHYGIPPANPFVNDPNKEALGEIYAYGFRNPHRITWTKAGQMISSHIGQAKVEELNLILPGHHYGWPMREGTFVIHPTGDINKVYPLPSDDTKTDFTYPVAQYDHDDGAAVSGGFEYTGTACPELKGKYLFADMNNGRLYYLDLSEVKSGNLAAIKEWKVLFNGKATTTAELCGSKRVDLRFGKDQNGEVYIFSKQDGKVYRLIPSGTSISKL